MKKGAVAPFAQAIRKRSRFFASLIHAGARPRPLHVSPVLGFWYLAAAGAATVLPLLACCTPQTLHEWVKRDQVDHSERDGVTTDERERLKALEREVKELRRANEILKVASAFFAHAELD